MISVEQASSAHSVVWHSLQSLATHPVPPPVLLDELAVALLAVALLAIALLAAV